MAPETKEMSTFDPTTLVRSLEGDSEAAFELLSRLVSDDPERQSEIIAAIEASDRQGLWRRLLEVLARRTWQGDPTPIERAVGRDFHRLEFAIRGLFGNQAAPAQAPKTAVLKEALDSEDVAVARQAALLLGRRHDEAALPYLARLLNSGDESWAIAAANVLGEMRDPRAAEELVRGVASSLVGLHRAAAQALEQMGQPAVPALIEALRHRDNHVRWHAARALGRVCDPESIPALLEALEDVDSGVRWLASEALIHLQEQALEPVLQNLLYRPVNAFLKDSSLHVLNQFQGGALWPILEPVSRALRSVDYATLGPVEAYNALQTLRAR